MLQMPQTSIMWKTCRFLKTATTVLCEEQKSVDDMIIIDHNRRARQELWNWAISPSFSLLGDFSPLCRRRFERGITIHLKAEYLFLLTFLFASSFISSFENKEITNLFFCHSLRPKKSMKAGAHTRWNTTSVTSHWKKTGKLYFFYMSEFSMICEFHD